MAVTASAAHRLANLAVLLGALAVGWLASEGVLLWRAGYSADHADGSPYRIEDAYVTSEPPAVFDPVMGHRRFPGPMRIVRVMRDEVVFDRVFKPNNRGYISARDYAYRKSDPAVLRVAALGDSFTASEFNAVSWPDRAHDSLRRRLGANGYEIYSFGVNGAGLANWHSIFFRDIAPNYQFDVLVIAIFGDDLMRPFSLLHYDGAIGYMARFDTQPRDEADFRANYLPKMPRHFVTVASEPEMDKLIASVRHGWRWPGLRVRTADVARGAVVSLRDRWQAAPPTVAKPADARLPADAVDDLKATVGPERFARLAEIMAYCRTHAIPVVLASVPAREEAKAMAAGRGAPEQRRARDIRALAESFGVFYFDGFAPFAAVDEADIDRRYWLKYDGHWNTAGSDLFAAAIADFLAANAAGFRRIRAAAPTG